MTFTATDSALALSPASVDTTTGNNVITVPGNVFSSTGAMSLKVAMAGPKSASQISSGGRIFDSTLGWQEFNPAMGMKSLPGRTLVVVHGVNSSVKMAFPCAPALMTAGGYDRVLGFDYDSTQKIEDSGKAFAAFLSLLPSRGATSVDIEAHSLGTLVASAAVPTSGVKVDNLVLLGGPLNGTPAADSQAGLLNWAVPDGSTPISISFLTKSISSGLTSELIPGSPVLTTIRNNLLSSASGPPNIIKVAGSESDLAARLVQALAGVPIPNDGIISESSALSSDYGGVGRSFPDLHTSLECGDQNIIDFVGGRVKNNPLPTPTPTSTPAPTPTPSPTPPPPSTRYISISPSTLTFSIANANKVAPPTAVITSSNSEVGYSYGGCSDPLGILMSTYSGNQITNPDGTSTDMRVFQFGLGAGPAAPPPPDHAYNTCTEIFSFIDSKGNFIGPSATLTLTSTP